MSWYLVIGFYLFVNIECTFVDSIAESVGVQNITTKYCEIASIPIYLVVCAVFKNFYLL